MTKYFFR